MNGKTFYSMSFEQLGSETGRARQNALMIIDS